jgi:hypothetical protein
MSGFRPRFSRNSADKSMRRKAAKARTSGQPQSNTIFEPIPIAEAKQGAEAVQYQQIPVGVVEKAGHNP